VSILRTSHGGGDGVGVTDIVGVTDGVTVLDGVIDGVTVLDGVTEGVVVCVGVTEGVVVGVGVLRRNEPSGSDHSRRAETVGRDRHRHDAVRRDEEQLAAIVRPEWRRGALPGDLTARAVALEGLHPYLGTAGQVGHIGQPATIRGDPC